MKKIGLLLFLLIICHSCHAEEKTTLMCTWKEKVTEAYTNKSVEKGEYSTIFIIEGNKLFNSNGKEIKNAKIEENEISFSIDTSDKKAHIKNSYSINRLSGSIKYIRDYKPKNNDILYRAITQGYGSCGKINFNRLF